MDDVSTNGNIISLVICGVFPPFFRVLPKLSVSRIGSHLTFRVTPNCLLANVLTTVVLLFLG